MAINKQHNQNSNVMNSNISMVAATNRQLNNFFQALPQWNIEAMTGYTPQTTFWMDFSIADRFGVSAIKDTFERAFNEWKNNHIYLTELVMVLNHKIWQHNENNAVLAELYNSLWEQADGYATTYLEGEELSYFYRITD